MLATYLKSLLPAVQLLLLLPTGVVLADHFDCKNAGGPGAVKGGAVKGMTKWCTASAQRFRGRTVYSCRGPQAPPGARDKSSRQVADWNVLKPRYLEFGEDTNDFANVGAAKLTSFVYTHLRGSRNSLWEGWIW